MTPSLSLSISIRSSASSSPKNAAIRWRTSSTGGRSCTSRPLCESVKWTCGWASASRVNASVVWPISVCVEPQELVPHRRVEEQIAHFDRRADRAADRRDRLRLRRRRLPARPRCRHRAVRLRSDQPADFGDRGQRFAAEAERARRENRSSAWRILLVAWLATASGSSSAAMPQPLSATRISSLPPCSTDTSIRVAPASTEFSSSSFTTLAGRSITSPAAILLTTLGDSWRISVTEFSYLCR